MTLKSIDPRRCIGHFAFALLGACTLPLAAQTLSVQLVDPAGQVGLMNERGDVVGTRTVYPCQVPGTCAPLSVPTVWTAAGARLTLPTQGSLQVSAAAIANDGTVVGSLTDFNTVGKAVMWKLANGSYTLTELGNLGLQQSYATGIDASGRIVGYAITPFVSTRPFVWSAGTGLVDLASAGAPAERLHTVSPAGRALSDNFSYLIDNPAAAQLLPTPPTGGPAYMNAVGFNFRVNDNGDLGGFLLTASQPRYFLFRHHAASGLWQQLAPDGVAPGSGIPVGVGRIDAKLTIGATLGRAVIAQGPTGMAVDVASGVSPAYPANAVGSLGSFSDQGVLLANMAIGGVSRAVKLLPTEPCTGLCLRVASIQMTGKVVRKSRANNCGQPTCTLVTATLKVTDANGTPQPNVQVGVRFMNSYTLDSAVAGRTGNGGLVTLKQLGLVGAGTVSMLVESASAAGARFDTGAGTLTATVIPQ